MNLYFCDLCNESIPQADLDLGRAVRRGERLICVACEAAMSSGPDPATAPVIPNVAPRVESGASNSSSSIAAVALAFASVALISGIGAGAYFFWRLERETQISREQIADLEHAAPEHARTVSAALTDEAAARETEAAATRAALQALSERVQELEQADPAATALERRIDNLDARLGAFDDLASRVQHQGGVLDQLTAAMAEATDAKAASAPAPAAPAPQEAARPAAPPPSASAPGGALWEKWIADLKSPDSGTRWQAVQSLGGTRDPSVVPHLVPMLKDADIFVRMAACRHLDELGSVEAIPALIDALEDEEAIVREAALAALRSLSGQALPFDPNARDGDRSKRVKAWRDWWEGASKELLARGKSKPAKS
jgi:Skp family chaperone for outer membrane proteins